MRPGLALLTAMLLAACTSLTAPTPSATATAEPTPTASPTPRASETPTHAPPTASHTPTPTPSADPAAMELEVLSCNGGTVLRWSPSRHPDFHHYIGLRSPEREIAPEYPPIAPAVDWGDLYATDRFVTSGHDATVVPSDIEWHYLVVAYDADGRPVSRSSVASGRILPHQELGAIAAEVLPDGAVRLSWDPFDGVEGCFSAYRVLHGTEGVASTLLTTISDPEAATLETRGLHPGTTYTLRVQAVRRTTLGHFVLAESEPLTFDVPTP